MVVHVPFKHHRGCQLGDDSEELLILAHHWNQVRATVL